LDTIQIPLDLIFFISYEFINQLDLALGTILRVNIVKIKPSLWLKSTHKKTKDKRHAMFNLDQTNLLQPC